MTHRQIIAVDVDDVLAYHAEALLNWSNSKYGTKLTIKDYTDNWLRLWSLSYDEAEERAVLFHKERQHRHFEPRRDALETLIDLKKQYDLVVVTARRQEVMDDSRQWLDRYYPDIFHDVRFVPIHEGDKKASKADVCKELGAMYLIDDGVGHCNLAAEAGVQPLLFGNYTWNRNEKLHERVVKVGHWQEVKAYFDERS